ncbi:MAG: hypothetical protein N2235_26240, partial [Fischerella sp.]|nr:hypothetical protein [Fischerella sp.]
MKKAILIDAAVKTHKGNVRGNNEDNFYFDGKYIKPEEAEGVSLSNKREDVSFLFGVCDGMGGENSGEKAAYMAANWLDNVRECIQNSDASLNDKAEQICESISRLNDQIYMKSKDTESFGMGTTLA